MVESQGETAETAQEAREALAQAAITAPPAPAAENGRWGTLRTLCKSLQQFWGGKNGETEASEDDQTDCMMPANLPYFWK